jgi:hypothetical protein
MARLVGLDMSLRLASGLPWLAQRATPPPPGTMVGDVAGYGAFLLYQFTPVGVALGIAGVIWLWRRARREAALLGAVLLANAAFSATYRVPDRFTFHLPSYVVFALFIAAGIAGVLGAADRRPRATPVVLAVLAVAAVAPVAVYHAAPGLLRAAGWSAATLGIPDVGHGARDGLAYFLDPNQRGDDSAHRFGHDALHDLPAGAVVLTPWPTDQEAWVVLRYAQLVEGVRPDVRLDLMLFAAGVTANDRLLGEARAMACCRPIYVTLPATGERADALEADYHLVPESGLYRLWPRVLPPATVTCCGNLDTTVPLRERLRRALP